MAEWSQGDVQTNGIRLHYYRTGGRKPPVVLLHGATDNGLCWSRLARALEADYDLVMVDARGHGLSDAPATGYGREDHAADVAGLIEALGLGRPVLMGHSMGAGTAATVAAVYPELVGGLVLEDPGWRAAPPDPAEGQARAARWREEIVAYRAKSVEELIAWCREHFPSWDDVEFGPWAQSKRQVSPNMVGGIGGPPAPWQETAKRLRCPGLLVTADPDKGSIVTAEAAQEALALWPQGKVVHIPGAGHNIRRERFEPYLEAVRAFLAEHTRA